MHQDAESAMIPEHGAVLAEAHRLIAPQFTIERIFGGGGEGGFFRLPVAAGEIGAVKRIGVPLEPELPVVRPGWRREFQPDGFAGCGRGRHRFAGRAVERDRRGGEDKALRCIVSDLEYEFRDLIAGNLFQYHRQFACARGHQERPEMGGIGETAVAASQGTQFLRRGLAAGEIHAPQFRATGLIADFGQRNRHFHTPEILAAEGSGAEVGMIGDMAAEGVENDAVGIDDELAQIFRQSAVEGIDADLHAVVAPDFIVALFRCGPLPPQRIHIGFVTAESDIKHFIIPAEETVGGHGGFFSADFFQPEGFGVLPFRRIDPAVQRGRLLQPRQRRVAGGRRRQPAATGEHAAQQP
ncbi:hypothetical protein SDC9_114289 [bioreactor metagenome]|uniref:Uncharacterized protein n=1 Tax=bioreactor metagenome TaxID=1076179 RepID=A0A645BQ41_9ZZZZ